MAELAVGRVAIAGKNKVVGQFDGDVAAVIAAGNDVIELACGPGGAGLAATARVGPSGSVVFADDAPGMLAAAEHRSAGLENTSTLLCGQEDIPLADETFDAVIIRHGLMFAADYVAAVAEAVSDADNELGPGNQAGCCIKST